MSTDLVTIPFHGTDLIAVDVDGKPQIVLRPAVESLGLTFDSQRRKLQSRSWACVTQRVLQLDGQRREHTVVDVRTFLMLLATINENNVAEDKRDLLIAYQSEVADVIEAYWRNGVVANPRAIAVQESPSGLDVIQAMPDEVRRVEANANAALEVATKTEARLDAIEGKHDWFSALGYARLHDLPTNTKFLQKLGGCAGRIGRSHGLEPTQVQHQLYGWANSWPAWVWDLAAEGFAR